MSASGQFPYVMASHIRIAEEFVSLDGLMNTYRVWTASIDTKSYAIDPYVPGPIIVMDRRGNTANEAYDALVEAIEAEGFKVVGV